ncbi:DUF5074 domain-containing protein [Bacteroides pyogenes]|uniref:DUF5074 domain-containing protein n=1 Tax=Bacteroides pyogenes TaxID=310300 RepID=UPI0003DC817A|nr:DUF5074 domain-containing protein [Bacteroides pyogenes]MBB3894137.1 hypothetical protein [Bacteroides pyogenes]GAE20755.1 hypothetical protein JCM10003_118 [Bacteroides pyogenes JCM 10003]SUV31922.1 lipoprotein [Bacteroides pyogenes]
MKQKILFLAAMALAAQCFTSCEKDDSDNPVPTGGAGNILLTTALPNADGMTGMVYMQLIEEPQSGGTLATNNNRALDIPYGGSYPLVIGSDVFVFPSYMGDTKNELVKYSRVNGVLQKRGVMSLPANNSANSIVRISSQKAYLSLAGLGMIYIFNPETMQKTGEIDLTSLGIQDKNPDIGIMIERDGYVFAGLSQMVAGWTSPVDYKQADVAVIDTKTDKLVKMISEKSRGFSQATRPIDPKSIFKDEKGDIYISCLGNFGMVAGHKAGMLRIKKGETDFDPTYFWTITGASIAGEEKSGGFIASICYVGNGKAYGYIDMPGYYKPGETGHSAISNRAVEFDIYNRTLKKIDGLELSNGYGILVSKYKDGMVISNASVTAKGIYYLNPATGVINPEPIITTVGNPMAIEYFGK